MVLGCGYRAGKYSYECLQYESSLFLLWHHTCFLGNLSALKLTVNWDSLVGLLKLIVSIVTSRRKLLSLLLYNYWLPNN